MDHTKLEGHDEARAVLGEDQGEFVHNVLFGHIYKIFGLIFQVF